MPCRRLSLGLLPVLCVALVACDDPKQRAARTSDAAVRAGDDQPARATDADDAAPEDTESALRDAAYTALGGPDGGLDAGADDAQVAVGAHAEPTDSGADTLPPEDAKAALAADAGDYAVGTTRVDIKARDGRTLPLQLWYPTLETARSEANGGHDVSEFEAPGARRDLLTRLLANAPPGCTNRRMHAALDAAPYPAAAPYPLLVYSHHNEGMRYALFSLAERLAQLGFVVAAPDHTGLTLYDRTDDLASEDVVAMALRFRSDALVIRAGDIASVLDVALDAEAEALPSALRGKLDGTRVGLFGHSMGSMTMGIVAQRDARVRAAAYLSFPPATVSTLLNLLDQPTIESFRVPALFMLNQEDAALNTVGGNDAIREQFAAHAPLAYLVEVKDTGHWSFADDCALIPDFNDGCGQGTRHEEPFDAYQNLQSELARQSAARYLAAFFGQQLLGAEPGPLNGTTSAPYELVRSHPALR
jgi:predicted dienelactone hydrolase